MKNNLIVIASYPAKGVTHGKQTVGVASYTKNTLVSLKKEMRKVGSNGKITVLAEELKDERHSYKDKGVFVKRIWKRDHPLSFYNIFKEIRKQPHTENILLEFELSMFGNLVNLLLLPLLLLSLRLLGKRIIFVAHQVVSDINELSGHINIEKNSLRSDSLNLLIRSFYFIILKTVSKIVVFDEVLKERLSRMGNSRKIVVIPHGVEKFSRKKSKREARNLLSVPQDRFILLYFGYLAWYKGADWLVNSFSELQEKLGKKVELVIAGGPNPNHLDKKYYLRYINQISKECEKNGITLTGFVPQDKIPTYFQASDLVIFPYRTFMSASGPLSLAFSFRKPFLISEKLKPILDTEDMKEILEALGVKKEKVTFDLSSDFVTKVKEVHKKKALFRKLTTIATEMRNMRDWNRIGKYYYDQLSAPH